MRLLPYELRLVRLALSYALFAGAMHRDGVDQDGCRVPFAGDARRRAHAHELLGRIDLVLAAQDEVRHDLATNAREEPT